MAGALEADKDASSATTRVVAGLGAFHAKCVSSITSRPVHVHLRYKSASLYIVHATMCHSSVFCAV